MTGDPFASGSVHAMLKPVVVALTVTSVTVSGAAGGAGVLTVSVVTYGEVASAFLVWMVK